MSDTTTNDYLTRILEAAESHSAFVSQAIPQVNIPEPNSATSKFTYNYYTADEMTPGSSRTTIQDPTNPSSTIDQSYVARRTYDAIEGVLDEDIRADAEASYGYYSNQTARFPMYNKISWNQVALDNPPIDDNIVNEIAGRVDELWHLAEHEGSFGSGIYSGIITPHINVYETTSAVNLDLAETIVQGQLEAFQATALGSTYTGRHGNISTISNHLDPYSKVQEIYASLSQAEGGYTGTDASTLGLGEDSFGMSISDLTAELVGVFSNYQVSDYNNLVDESGISDTFTSDDDSRYAFLSENNVSFSSSVHNSVYGDVFAKAGLNLLSWYYSAYRSGASTAKMIQKNQNISDRITEGMFPVINPVTVAFPEDTTSATAEIADNEVPASVVGYLVEKYTSESGDLLTPNGGGDDTPQILISPYADGNELTDSDVVYGHTYNYSVRTIVLIQIPIINKSPLGDDSSQAGYAYVLTLSREVYTNPVQAIDSTPPPSPSNLDFIYNYSDSSLFLHWEMPTNPQEDIIAFQVFRRASLDEPYELIKQYDWDKSEVPYPQVEASISPRLVVYGDTAEVSCTDYDFTKDSTYYYAVCSVDARRLSSGYSSQFEVSFNRFKNKIAVKKTSFPGAPKPYPNLYITSDTFQDTIKTSQYDTFFVFFNPDFYYLSDSAGNDLDLISLDESKPTYHMNVLNLDIQQMETIDIKIKDPSGNFRDIKP